MYILINYGNPVKVRWLVVVPAALYSPTLEYSSYGSGTY